MTHLIKTFQFRHQKCWREELINPRHLHTPTSTSNTQTHVRNLHIIKIKPTHDIQTNQMNQCKSKQRTLNIKEHNLQIRLYVLSEKLKQVLVQLWSVRSFASSTQLIIQLSIYFLLNSKCLCSFEVFGDLKAANSWSYICWL